MDRRRKFCWSLVNEIWNLQFSFSKSTWAYQEFIFKNIFCYWDIFLSSQMSYFCRDGLNNTRLLAISVWVACHLSLFCSSITKWMVKAVRFRLMLPLLASRPANIIGCMMNIVWFGVITRYIAPFVLQAVVLYCVCESYLVNSDW